LTGSAADHCRLTWLLKQKRPERLPVPALIFARLRILNFSFPISEFQRLPWWPTARSVHDAGAGHGPVALAGAAAQRADTHLIREFV
jgi:hypothetical protein